MRQQGNQLIQKKENTHQHSFNERTRGDLWSLEQFLQQKNDFAPKEIMVPGLVDDTSAKREGFPLNSERVRADFISKGPFIQGKSSSAPSLLKFFPSLDNFYFLNLVFLFFLVESLNFSLLGAANRPQKQKYGRGLIKISVPKTLQRGRLSSVVPGRPSLTENSFLEKAFLLNPLKLGFLFGVFVDAFKVGS